MSGSNNMTVVYVDISTFDELEELMYAGAAAANIFHSRITKVIWFGQIPIRLRNQGTADFGQTFTVTQPRNGDYATYTWARISVNRLQFADAAAATAAGYEIGFVPDLGHAIFREVSFLVNEVPLHQTRQAAIHQDVQAHHHVDESHWDNYQVMIGNVEALVGGSSLPTPDLAGVATPDYVLNVPMWVFYMKNGAAFPHSSIPYADVKWEFTLRDFAQLVQVRSTAGVSSTTVIDALTPASRTLGRFELWTNYIVTTSDMRTQMGRIPRQMLIEQVQDTTQAMSVTGDTNVDLRFAYSMRYLTWVAQNVTRGTTPIGPVGGPFTAGQEWTNYTDALGSNPIQSTSIKYENATRLDSMPADYHGQVVQFFHFARSPKKVGFQTWSLAYFASAFNPSGSVNTSRMYNMSAVITPAADIADGYVTQAGAAVTAAFRLVFLAYVHQVVLFQGGGIVLEFH